MQRLFPPVDPMLLCVPSRDSRSARILCVENDSALRGFLILVLNQAGYEATPASDGVHGWEALRAGKFDLLITDNEMPRLSGVELVAKARLAGMRLPVVMISGSVMEGPDFERLELAARLQEPFLPDDLLETVRLVLHGIPHVALWLTAQNEPF